MPANVAVIGAGWAGLSCAWHLSQAGIAVHLIDAATQAGGRARNSPVRLQALNDNAPGQQDSHEIVADNGQHMMIGAYRESLSLLAAIGQTDALARHPLQFESKALSLRRRGPGRLGLAFGFSAARGLNWPSRVALLRLSGELLRHRWQGFERQTVAQLLERTGQTRLLIEQFWQPLCIAAFNTDIDQACAQTFVNVLHDAFMLSGDSSDFLVSRPPLGELLAAPMLANLTEQGMQWSPGSLVSGLSRSAETGDRARWQLTLRDQTGSTPSYRAVVLATPVWVSARLLGEHVSIAQSLRAFSFAPIRTVYLAWPASARVELPPITLLTEDRDKACFGQWLFARESIDDLTIAAVVISLGDRATDDNHLLCQQVARQVHNQCALPEPVWAACINEKRATFICDPDRPVVTATTVGNDRLPEGLLLAGDYCVHRYPATLESAVIAGKQAAAKAIDELAEGD